MQDFVSTSSLGVIAFFCQSPKQVSWLEIHVASNELVCSSSSLGSEGQVFYLTHVGLAITRFTTLGADLQPTRTEVGTHGHGARHGQVRLCKVKDTKVRQRKNTRITQRCARPRGQGLHSTRSRTQQLHLKVQGQSCNSYTTQPLNG